MSIDLQSVGEGSDNLQLIKFWPSRAPGKGVCGGAKIFGSALLQPARSVCVCLSAFFIRPNSKYGQCHIDDGKEWPNRIARCATTARGRTKVYQWERTKVLTDFQTSRGGGGDGVVR